MPVAHDAFGGAGGADAVVPGCLVALPEGNRRRRVSFVISIKG
jgi:hypothetical protein